MQMVLTVANKPTQHTAICLASYSMNFKWICGTFFAVNSVREVFLRKQKPLTCQTRYHARELPFSDRIIMAAAFFVLSKLGQY